MFVVPVSRSSAGYRPAVAPSLALADRLLDESFARFLGGRNAESKTRTPAMDVSESDTAYTLTFDVPGATREQLKVSVEGRRVTLSHAAADAAPAASETKPDEAKPADRPLYRERTPAVYSRVVSLPAEVDQSASQAKFDNGVLTLVLAKKVPAGATQLTIG